MSTSDNQTLPRARGTSLHRQLFVVLRERIVRGIYPAGSIIPKEDDLCVQFGVSRITVRRALMDLQTEGLLERRQGRGTFVSANVTPARPSATANFIESLRKVAVETSVEVVSLDSKTPAPADIAAQLHLRTDQRAVHVQRLRKLKRINMMVLDTWLPEKFGKTVTIAALKKRALFELLLEQGVVFGQVIEEFTAIAADPALAATLNCEIGVPLIRMTRLLYDTHREPVQHLTMTMSPDRSRILMDSSVDTDHGMRTRYIVHGNDASVEAAAGARLSHDIE